MMKSGVIASYCELKTGKRHLIKSKRLQAVVKYDIKRPNDRFGLNSTTAWNATRFIGEIFRELLAYLKYFYEFCINVVRTMV